MEALLRLSRPGAFKAFFQILAGCSETAHMVQFFDNTTLRAHVSAAGAKGGSSARHSAAPAAASRLKPTQDRSRRPPLDFHLTGGGASDSTQFTTSLDIGPDIRPLIAMTDKGYDSHANRAAARVSTVVQKEPQYWSAPLGVDRTGDLN